MAFRGMFNLISNVRKELCRGGEEGKRERERQAIMKQMKWIVNRLI